MIIYIVVREIRHGFCDIWGVYSTRELAENRLKQILEMDHCPVDSDMQIQEHVVDQTITF